MSALLRGIAWSGLLLSVLLVHPLHAAAPVPTVIVDIHAMGAQRLAALKAEPDVLWSAEFGNELLLGLVPERVPGWLLRSGVRDGLGVLAQDEIWVRDHVCTHLAQQPALGVVGGYEVLRMPPALVRYAKASGVAGTALPPDGVQARELANTTAARAKAAPQRPAVAEIVARVNPPRWFAAVEQLAVFNRNSFSPQLTDARDWVLNQFADIGLSTETFPYVLQNLSNCGTPSPPPLALTNPIGIKRGVELPDEWIVVGAHYDSRNSSRCDGGSAVPQPGANDNATGCAGVIELARVFAAERTQRSILFMCFSGEEQGLFGSRRYVEALQASGEITKVKHMINLDMLGFDAGGALDARVETNAANVGLLTDYAGAAATYAPELNLITSSNSNGGSDHFYFLGAGVPAVFTWENGASNYPHYHRDTDVPANLTNGQALAGGILKMDAAMLADKAGLFDLLSDGFE